MAALIWSLLLIAFGVAALAYSSDWFVDGAAVLADRLSVPPVVIGTLVIGLGTSLPEVFVSTLAAVDGDLNLGIGNIVGSNTANLTVVLGVAAMIGVVRVDSEIVRREALLMLGSCVLIALLAWQKLTLVGGLVLLVGLVGYLVLTAVQAASVYATGTCAEVGAFGHRTVLPESLSLPPERSAAALHERIPQ